MNDIKSISFVAYEAEMSRQERKNRRLWILSIVTLAALILTNVIWICKVVVCYGKTADR